MNIIRQLFNTCLKEEIAKKHGLQHKRRKQEFQLLKGSFGPQCNPPAGDPLGKVRWEAKRIRC
jgi:hypothetical protein